MAKLISRATEVITQMKENQKVEILSFEDSAKIDNELALALQKVKTEFEVKEKNSRAFVAQVELASFNKFQ